MMGHRESMKGSDEINALKSKQFHIWRTGQRARVKRKFNKRIRKTARFACHFHQSA